MQPSANADGVVSGLLFTHGDKQHPLIAHLYLPSLPFRQLMVMCCIDTIDGATVDSWTRGPSCSSGLGDAKIAHLSTLCTVLRLLLQFSV